MSPNVPGRELIVIALKRILVPTDFSEGSEAAVKYGVALARAFNAQLHLLHVVLRHDLDMIAARQSAFETFLTEMPETKSPPDLEESVQHAARELLSKILTEQEQKDLRVEYVLRAMGPGGPYVEIVRYAKQGDVDLIVMGTHGRGFVAHMMMGSVAEKVVRSAPCPVLTVRHPQHEFVLAEERAEPAES
jgi:nucleotide-binding universal stress UspA family protein